MIAIVNIDNKPRLTGPHKYEVRINLSVQCTFKHNREDGLAACLRRAADAVEADQRKRQQSIMLALTHGGS